MKKIFWLIVLYIIFIGNYSFGVQIVYPKSKNVTINSDKTFFAGNESPNRTLKINSKKVNLHPSGGFRKAVNLNYGLNTFTIDNGKEKVIYKITRPKQVNKTDITPSAIIYKNSIFISIIKDNTPLRSTPIDKGFNRLQHFNKGIEFEAIGEERGFYKVKLSRDDFGFISKDCASEINKKNLANANIKALEHKTEHNNKYIKISLDKQVPYALSESEHGLDIVVYNTDNQFQKYEDFIEGKPFGYTSYYNDNNELIISMKKFPITDKKNPLKNIRITIDPGHGGNELGATGCLGTQEKDLNLEIAKILKNKLTKLGAIVNMTRENDTFVELNERVELTNNFNSDIFISIHNNSIPDSAADKDVTGTELYYFYPQSRELAKILAESISQRTGFKNGKARGQSFAVIRNTHCIAILAEIGYLINPEDNYKLINKDFQNKITDGIIDGLEKYLRQ